MSTQCSTCDIWLYVVAKKLYGMYSHYYLAISFDIAYCPQKNVIYGSCCF